MAKNTEEIRTEAKIGLDDNSNTHPRRVTSQHWTQVSFKQSQFSNVSHQNCIGRSHANSAHKTALTGKALFHQRFWPTAAWLVAFTQQNESSRLQVWRCRTPLLPRLQQKQIFRQSSLPELVGKCLCFAPRLAILVTFHEQIRPRCIIKGRSQ